MQDVWETITNSYVFTMLSTILHFLWYLLYSLLSSLQNMGIFLKVLSLTSCNFFFLTFLVTYIDSFPLFTVWIFTPKIWILNVQYKSHVLFNAHCYLIITWIFYESQLSSEHVLPAILCSNLFNWQLSCLILMHFSVFPFT